MLVGSVYTDSGLIPLAIIREFKMAKKKVRQVTVRKQNRNQNQNSSDRGSMHAWDKITASQALMAARGFKPFDYLVRRLDELSELVVDVDKDAEISLESRSKLVNQAQLILGGNVLSKKAAKGKKDVAWVQAAWAHPEGSERLDPVTTFEVGVAVARNQRPYEECERASRFLRFEGELPLGLSMLPDEEGDHLNVPMLGILLKPNLVEVRRNGKVLGTASIWHSLIGFEERDKARFAKPTREEELEAAALRREERQRNKAEKAAADKARKEQEALDALGDCFNDVWNEWEEAEAEKKQAEMIEKWQEFVAGNQELRDLWEIHRKASNEAYEGDREVIEALQVVLRPIPPGKEDLRKALPCVRDYIQSLSAEHARFRWGMLMSWVKDVPARRGLSLSRSLTKANDDLPWLLPHWFVTEEGLVTPLYPLKPLGEYGRELWIARLAMDPVIVDEDKSKLFSLAGEE